jgi:DNA-binding Lrp family transcriptional regulator
VRVEKDPNRAPYTLKVCPVHKTEVLKAEAENPAPARKPAALAPLDVARPGLGRMWTPPNPAPVARKSEVKEWPSSMTPAVHARKTGRSRAARATATQVLEIPPAPLKPEPVPTVEVQADLEAAARPSPALEESAPPVVEPECAPLVDTSTPPAEDLSAASAEHTESSGVTTAAAAKDADLETPAAPTHPMETTDAPPYWSISAADVWVDSQPDPAGPASPTGGETGEGKEAVPSASLLSQSVDFPPVSLSPDKTMKRLGIKKQKLIEMIEAHPGLTYAELAEMIGLNANNVSVMLTELRRKGIVAKAVSRAHPRSGLVYLEGRVPEEPPVVVVESAEIEALKTALSKAQQEIVHIQGVLNAAREECDDAYSKRNILKSELDDVRKILMRGIGEGPSPETNVQLAERVVKLIRRQAAALEEIDQEEQAATDSPVLRITRAWLDTGTGLVCVRVEQEKSADIQLPVGSLVRLVMVPGVLDAD